MKQKLIVANWKLNGNSQNNSTLIKELISLLTSNQKINADIVICPPIIYLDQVSKLIKDSLLMLGSQDISRHDSGAFTGEISAKMLQDFCCQWSIIGHSERREYQYETDQIVMEKAEQATTAGVNPICCVGESLAQREAGKTEEVINKQVKAILQANKKTLDKLVIAYEPIWAIGTGITASPEEAGEVHQQIHQQLQNKLGSDNKTVLYGGSVNENNAKVLSDQQGIDGFLVGGASLKPQSFYQICEVF